jgi:hypothetical protein
MPFQPRWLWIAAAAVLVIAAVFAFDLTPWVRGGFGWRWEYDPVSQPVWGYVLLVLLYVVLAWTVLQRASSPRAALTLAFTASAALAFAAVWMRDADAVYTLFARTFSQVATAHHWGSAQIDWSGGEWRDWTGVMARVGSHVGTSPPGLPMMYALAADVSQRTGLDAVLARPLITALCVDYRIYDLTLAEVASGWLGVLSPVWAALAVFPIYALAKRAGARPELAVLWWPLVPGLAGFAGSVSTLFPLFTVVMMLPLAGGLTARRAAVAGLVFGIATFTNFALLPLAGLAGYFVLIRWLLMTPRPPFAFPIRIGAAFALAAMTVWAVWFAFTGETPFDLLRQSFDTHLELERPYAFWVWFHLWDWIVWSGVGLVIAAVVASREYWRSRVANPELAALAAALILTLLTLTLSGITRGESGRIWLFLSPLLPVLIAGGYFDWRAGWLPLASAQASLTIALVFAVNAFNAPDVPPQPVLQSASSDAAPLAVFTAPDGGRFALISAQQADPDTLELAIRGEIPTLAPVWFGLIGVDADGETYSVEPQQPVYNGERLPSACWRDQTETRVFLSLPDMSAGAFYVSLSAYGYRAGDPPLVVQTAEGEDTQIGLGPFTANAE